MDITTLFQLSHMNILAINFESDVEIVRAIFGFLNSILTMYFLVKGFIFVFERRDEKKHHEAILRDKNLLNKTVVLLMSKLLQSDKKEMYANKLAFAVNYIRSSFNKITDLDNIIDNYLFKYISPRNGILNERIYKHIKNVRHTLLNPQGWFRDLKRMKEYSVYGELHNRNDYLCLHDDHVKELALSLEDYLSDEQKKYLSYLLFQMAYMDGYINKQEEADLKMICVNHFLSDEEFHALKNSFDSKSEGNWFYKNLREKNPELYSDPKVVSNIFTQSTEPDKGTDTKFIIKESLSDPSFAMIFLFFQSIVSISVLISTKPAFLAFFFSVCLAILFFKAIHYNSKSISDIYDTAFTRKDYLYLVKEYFYADLLCLLNIIFIFFA